MSIDTSKLWMISVQDDEAVQWIRSPFNDATTMRAFSYRYLSDEKYSEFEVFTEKTLDMKLDICVDKDTKEIETVTLRQVLFGHRYQEISNSYQSSDEFRKKIRESKIEKSEEF